MSTRAVAKKRDRLRCKKAEFPGQSRSVTRLEAIPDPGLGENVLRSCRVRLDLLSQLADENAQVLGLLDIVAPPNRRQQRTVRENFPSMTGQMDHQIKLFRR